MRQGNVLLCTNYRERKGFLEIDTSDEGAVMRCWCIVILGILLGLGPWAYASEIEETVTTTLEAYGGLEALSGVEVVKQTGHIHAQILHQGQKGKLVRFIEAPERLRVEIAYPDSETEVRVLDGQRAVRDGQVVKGPPAEAMRGQLYRLDLPMLLHRHRELIVDRGTIRQGGREVRRLEIPFPSRLTITIDIDSESHLILRCQVAFPVGPTFIMTFETAYDDFRKVGSILFPFSEQNFAQGRHTADTKLDTIELLNTRPKDSIGGW